MKHCCLFFALTFLSGCLALDSDYQATVAAHEAGEAGKPPNTDNCVYIGDVGKWESFSPYYIYIEDTSDGGQYLFTMRSMCLGIMQDVVIDVPYNNGRVCRNGGDRLAYRDLTHRRTCSIKDFDIVESRDEAERLTASQDD
ncbi:MAG: DUF6491 family protein [Woeseiaceae bacterium]